MKNTAKKKSFSVSYEGKKLRTKMNKSLARLKKKKEKERLEALAQVLKAKETQKKTPPPPVAAQPVTGIDLRTPFSKTYVDKVQKTVRIKRTIIQYLEAEEVKTGVTPVTAIAQIIENWFEQMQIIEIQHGKVGK